MMILGKQNCSTPFFASVFVEEPPGELPVFDTRYHGVPVTSLKTDIETLTKHLKNLNTSKSMGQMAATRVSSKKHMI